MAASVMCAGVSKSGSPISRWMIFRPCTSSALAIVRTSNADSVPSRAIRLASSMATSSEAEVFHRRPRRCRPYHAPVDPAAFDVITFDCYGTLIDWEAGMVASLRRIASWPVTDEELLERFATHEAEAEGGPYRPYREILATSALGIARDVGIDLTEEAARRFEVALEEIGLPTERVLHAAQSLFHDHVPAKRLGLSTVWIDRRAGKVGSGATPPAEAEPDATYPSLAAFADATVGGTMPAPGKEGS